MSGTRVAIYWAGFLLLGSYYVTSLEPLPSSTPARRAAFVEVDAKQVEAVLLQREERNIRCERVGERWRPTLPAGADLSSDLVASLLANLTETPDVEMVSEGGGNLHDFGLDPARTTLTLERGSLPPIVVRIGVANPAETATYAQRTGSDRVFLIGLNVRYYADLLFAAAFAAQ